MASHPAFHNVIEVISLATRCADDQRAGGRRLPGNSQIPLTRAAFGDGENASGYIGGGVTVDAAHGGEAIRSDLGYGDIDESDGIVFVGVGICRVVMAKDGVSAIGIRLRESIVVFVLRTVDQEHAALGRVGEEVVDVQRIDARR